MWHVAMTPVGAAARGWASVRTRVEWRSTPTCRRLCGAGDVVHERPQSFSQVGHGCIWIKKSLTPRSASQAGKHVAEREAGLVRVPRKRRKLRGPAALTM